MKNCKSVAHHQLCGPNNAGSSSRLGGWAEGILTGFSVTYITQNIDVPHWGWNKSCSTSIGCVGCGYGSCRAAACSAVRCARHTPGAWHQPVANYGPEVHRYRRSRRDEESARKSLHRRPPHPARALPNRAGQAFGVPSCHLQVEGLTTSRPIATQTSPFQFSPALSLLVAVDTLYSARKTPSVEAAAWAAWCPSHSVIISVLRTLSWGLEIVRSVFGRQRGCIT